MTEAQTDIVGRLERVNWTKDSITENGSVHMIAYSFDGMINKFGWVNPDGDLTIRSPEGVTTHKAEELQEVLV